MVSHSTTKAIVILCGAAWLHQAAAQNTGFKGCDALLDAGLGEIVVFPVDEAYSESVSSYYSSENRRLRPFCIAQPRSTDDVSEIIKTLATVSAAGNWDIAIRSGGHSDFDSSAVSRGVTIDLSHLNKIEVQDKCVGKWTGETKLIKNIASVGPGARWGKVYETLEKQNISAAGGRAGAVGVGGLLLSGGASFHTQYWGFSCNGVVKYEVVLGDGSVVEATEDENEDLFRALKGGGSNLGIVTRFDLRTYTVNPEGAYGGLIFGTWPEQQLWTEQFVKYASTSSGSPDHWFLLYRNDGGNLGIMSMAVSTDGKENSTTFAPFNDFTITRDMRAKQSLSSIAASISDTGGSHYIPWALTLQPTKAIMDKAAEIFVEVTKALEEAGVPVSVNFVFQPLPKHPKGTTVENIMGHDKNLPTDSILFEARITLPAEQATLGGIAQHIVGQGIEDLRRFSAAQEDHSTFLYMNYAHPEQDVISSYGEDNLEFLKSTAEKYDPEGFFQRRVTGGWKVSRVN